MDNYSLDGIYFHSYNFPMSWEVEYTDEFENWWKTLTEKEQVSISASVRLLEVCGPNPRRKAILLIGGDKSGDKRWYDVYIPIAESAL
ncbi:MAG: hypothetical protein U5K27_17075 [Desulfotignum sp.]|nr:hypothetical protein [Desulfotignum sp.]